jgi:hypothetical protein
LETLLVALSEYEPQHIKRESEHVDFSGSKIQVDDLNWSVCGVLYATDTASRKKDVRAYPCGLWMIMHYITVVTSSSRRFQVWCQEQQQQHYKLQLQKSSSTTSFSLGSGSSCAEYVAQVLKSVVRDIFRCHDCSSHFVTTFDACEFNRPGCENEIDNGARNNKPYPVDVWLFKLHNGVTQRIHAERSGTALDNDSLDAAPWPRGRDIPPKSKLRTDEDISEFLHSVYIDPAWSSLASL